MITLFNHPEFKYEMKQMLVKQTVVEDLILFTNDAQSFV